MTIKKHFVRRVVSWDVGFFIGDSVVALAATIGSLDGSMSLSVRL